MKTDFLVIGSGAAGLSFALKAAAHGHVTIVTKGAIEECNTNYAQGGICSVTYAPDTFEKHIRDTLICGAGKCDEKAVELVVRRAPELIADLIAWGTRFDKTPTGVSSSTAKADTRSTASSTTRTSREPRSNGRSCSR